MPIRRQTRTARTAISVFRMILGMVYYLTLFSVWSLHVGTNFVRTFQRLRKYLLVMQNLAFNIGVTQNEIRTANDVADHKSVT